MSKPNRSFRMEQLESRELMAGDVAAVVSGGNLYLNEALGQAGQDNKVYISQLANGQVRVAGATGSDTLINGQAFQDFTVPESLYANFGGGNDLAVFSETAPPSFNEIHLNMGVPIAEPGTDDDNVILWSVKSRDSVFIDAGADDDWVFISKAKIGDGVGVDDLIVNAGAGADTVTIKNSPLNGDLRGSVDVTMYDSPLEDDADTAWFENVTVMDDLRVRMGAGDDLFHIENASVKDDLDLSMGAGNDTAEANLLFVIDDFMTRMGEGNDSLRLDYLWATDVNVMGEGGTDSLTRSNTGNVTNFEKSGWEIINGRPTWWDDVFAFPTVKSAKLAKY